MLNLGSIMGSPIELCSVFAGCIIPLSDADSHFVQYAWIAAWLLPAQISTVTPQWSDGLSQLKQMLKGQPCSMLVVGLQVLASKKGAMRALGRLARHDAAAIEIASNSGLPPLVALLDCEDASLVRR